MIYYHRIDVSEGVGVTKTKKSNECDVCHYWYFKFQIYVCSGCHVLMMSMYLDELLF